MDYVDGNIVFDKSEAKAIRDHIDMYGLTVGLKLKVDYEDKTVDFIGQQNLSLRFVLDESQNG